MDPLQIANWIAALAEEEQALTRRLASVRTARLALASLQPDEPVEFEGKLADACRAVLKNHRGSLSPTEVRDHVRALGYDLAKHENEMAAIHGVLKRLHESGDVKTKEWKKQPGTRYHWADESIWTSKPPPDSAKATFDLAALLDPKSIAGFKTAMDTIEKASAVMNLDKMAKQMDDATKTLNLPDNSIENLLGLKPKK